MSARKVALGRWLVYGLVLIPVVGGLAYYWLEYVPSQREYFTNLRFRALSMAAQQVRTKTALLASGLEHASGTDDEKYVRLLLPDLDYGCGRRPGPKQIPKLEIRMDASRTDVLRFFAGRKCIAEARFDRLYAAFMEESLFDDLLLADQNGRVIYQHSTSGVRIATLKELMAPREVKAQDHAPPRQGRGSDADMTTQILLDGSLYEMLVQPLRIANSTNADLDWVICGLVREARAAGEARHVPPKHLLWVFVPLLILALSGPFLKLMLLKHTGRLAFADVILLTAFTICVAGFITLFMTAGYWRGYENLDRELECFANRLDKGIGKDFKRMWLQLQHFDETMMKCPGQLQDRPNLFGQRSKHLLPSVRDGELNFDFVFWTSASGCQVAKWTTRLEPTAKVSQLREPHFDNARAGRFWTLAKTPKSRFSVQPVFSPTTSEFTMVLTALSKCRAEVKCPEPSRPNSAHGPVKTVSIVALPRSVVQPLLPPQTGFALIGRDGRVLFHSSVERNLRENLFEEIRSPQPLRALVAAGVRGHLSAYYRGLEHRFHVHPLESVRPAPHPAVRSRSSWTLVVFKELEPQQAMRGLVWMESSLLFVLLLGTFGLFLAAASLAARLCGWTWRRQVDKVLSVIWPSPIRSGAYWWTAKSMAILLAVAGESRSEEAKGFLLKALETRRPDYYKSAAAFRNTKIRRSQPAAWRPVVAAWWECRLNQLRNILGPVLPAQTIDARTLIDSKEWSIGNCGRWVLSDGEWFIHSAMPRLGLPNRESWWLGVVLLLAAAYAWIHASIKRLYLTSFRQVPLPGLTELPPPATSDRPVLVLGLPLSKKDESLRKWLSKGLGYQPPCVNLHREQFRENWVEAAIERVQRDLARQGMGGAFGQDQAFHPWVHISNLEAKLDDPAHRSTVLDLLERLLSMELGGEHVCLAVTSAVDPMFHFDSMLAEERKRTYENPLPELEVQRWARVLNNFRKVQLDEVDGPPAAWCGERWKLRVWKECRGHPALQVIAEEIVASTPEESREAETVLARIEERALALYKLIWASCTRPEKLLLVQLAQTGMVNPLARETLQELVRKGLIVLPPKLGRPHIMNETFRRFLETAEAPRTVRAWEREGGESAWLIIRNVVAGLIVVALIMLAETQHQELQSAIKAVGAATAALGGLTPAVRYLAGRRQTQFDEVA